MKPYKEELLADFDLVCQRLFGDEDKAADAVAQLHTYKGAGYWTGMRARGVTKVACYDFFDAYCYDLPELGFVARRVLSKQVGVGAVERSHKVMKNVVFSSDRPNLDPGKADRDLFTNLNTRALDRVASTESPIPHWVVYYDENDDE